MKFQKIKLVFIIWLMFLSMPTKQVIAQPLPPGTHGSTSNESNGAPVDGGLSFLLLISTIFTVKKIHRLNTKVNK